MLETQWSFSHIPRHSAGAFPCHPPGRALLLTGATVHGDAGAEGVAAAAAAFHPAVGDTLVLLADTRCKRSAAVSQARRAGSRARRGTTTRALPPGRTDKAAPHRPGVACPHPPLPPRPPALRSRAPGLPSGRGQRGAIRAGRSCPLRAPAKGAGWCRHLATWGAQRRAGGGPGAGELGQERGGQRGAGTHSSAGQWRRRRAAAAGAQPRRAASWLGRAAGRGEAGGKSSGTRAERERCVRGSGGGAM